MAYQRPCDAHPALPVPKPRRPPQFDESYNPMLHCLMFDPSGHLIGYRPRAIVTQPTTNLNEKDTK